MNMTTIPLIICAIDILLMAYLVGTAIIALIDDLVAKSRRRRYDLARIRAKLKGAAA